MRKIIHLSDLHFGRVDHKRVDPLKKLIKKISPDMIVISGDFTQRAKESEFALAQKFIQDLSFPVFVVPGNHDLPLYNVVRRFHKPFTNYKKYISEDLSPLYIDDKVALIGINSARSVAISSGRINKKQIDKIEDEIKSIDNSLVKIVVCHHPFDLPASKKTHHNYTHKVVGRSKMAMERLAKLGIDIFLSGHLHVNHVGDSTLRYKIEGYSALIIQAGTAISTRSRGEPVSFNVLHINPTNVLIDHYSGDQNSVDYIHSSTEKFVRTEEGWKKGTIVFTNEDKT